MHILVLSTILASASAQGLLGALQADPDLSTLVEVIGIVPGLASTLNSSSDITILAPTNEAFEILFNDPLNAENLAIEERIANATNILLDYHVIRGQYPSSAFEQIPTFVSTLFTNELTYFGNARTNVTDGQHLGLYTADGAARVLCGDLEYVEVVEAVRLPGYQPSQS
jgi:uncharacterized surface protein with fasciclin (FAS1) repeats